MTPLTRDQGCVSRAILPTYVGRPFPLVSVLATYFDDSREDREGKKILAIAGYLSDVTHWDVVFAPAWDEFLSDASWPSRITEYKASDCRGGFGQFKDWPPLERDRCTRRAVAIIRDSFPSNGLAGFGVALEMPPTWNEALRRTFLPFAYYVCANITVRRMLEIAGILFKDSEGDELRLIFDDQKGAKGRVWDRFFERLEEIGTQSYAVSRPQFEDSKKVIPLQAADLLAFETYKEVKNRRDEPWRPRSAALTALLDAHFHEAMFINAATTQRLLVLQRLGKLPSPEESVFEILYQSGTTLGNESYD